MEVSMISDTCIAVRRVTLDASIAEGKGVESGLRAAMDTVSGGSFTVYELHRPRCSTRDLVTLSCKGEVPSGHRFSESRDGPKRIEAAGDSPRPFRCELFQRSDEIWGIEITHLLTLREKVAVGLCAGLGSVLGLAAILMHDVPLAQRGLALLAAAGLLALTSWRLFLGVFVHVIRSAAGRGFKEFEGRICSVLERRGVSFSSDSRREKRMPQREVVVS